MARTPAKIPDAPQLPFMQKFVRPVEEVSIPQRGFKAIRPMDDEFDDAAAHLDKLKAAGKNQVVEIFMPRDHLELISRNPSSRPAGRRVDARARDNKLRDQIGRWFASWKLRHPERESLQLNSAWRRADTDKEYGVDGISAFVRPGDPTKAGARSQGGRQAPDDSED